MAWGDVARRGGVAVRALVLGGGAEVWDDLARLEEMLGRPWSDMVVAANDIGCHWERELDHWVTLHPDRMKGWAHTRAAKGYPSPGALWSRHSLNGKFKAQGLRAGKNWGGGSSGMMACAVAVDMMGANRVVLCGVPMTKTPHFAASTVHQRAKAWTSADGHFRVWRREVGRMRGVIRSMSGRTRELLGAPTLAWLNEETAHG